MLSSTRNDVIGVKLLCRFLGDFCYQCVWLHAVVLAKTPCLRRKMNIIQVFLLLCLFHSCSAQTVTTTKGIVKGYITPNNAFAFLGIPFAKPPLGNLRFMVSDTRKKNYSRPNVTSQITTSCFVLVRRAKITAACFPVTRLTEGRALRKSDRGLRALPSIQRVTEQKHASVIFARRTRANKGRERLVVARTVRWSMGADRPQYAGKLQSWSEVIQEKNVSTRVFPLLLDAERRARLWVTGRRIFPTKRVFPVKRECHACLSASRCRRKTQSIWPRLADAERHQYWFTSGRECMKIEIKMDGIFLPIHRFCCCSFL